MTTTIRPTTVARRRGALPPFGVLLSLLAIAVLLVASVVPELLTSQDPYASDPADAFAAPSAEHWLGTDQLGRDLYTRLVYGAWYSISLGVGATLIALVGGIALGVLAGYTRGWTDRFITRFLDILLAFPEVLVALIAIAVLGPGQASVIWAVGLGRIPGSARLVRAQVLQVRESDYVANAVALGLRPVPLVVRHVIPNSLGPVLVNAVLGVGVSIIFGAALSFLGLGAVPPIPEWGLMLSEARQYLSIAPALAIWPGVMITVTVISITVAGRWAQQRYVSRRTSL